jgi:hypothetical protein
MADDLAHVLWLGGMSGVGKTTAARALARHYDLRLYSLDSHTYEHAAKLPPEAHTLDELWVDTTPTALANWFENHSRERFALVLDDLHSLPRDAPVIADGPQLLPELIAPHVTSRARALFVVAQPELQRRLITTRGSGLYERTRDPKSALENRLGRDDVLSSRTQAAALEHGFTVVEVGDVTETSPAVEQHLRPLLQAWIARDDRGDVAGRRRDENDARFRQWRANVNATGASPAGEIDAACECERPGCAEILTIGLREAEAARTESRPLVANSHS